MADPVFAPPRVTVNSPVVDELLTQVSDVHAAVAGRRLSANETTLAQEVFFSSVDFSRVRLLFGLLERTTVGNTIRLPADFSLVNNAHKELLIHEMTHVWQFQHFGPGYITTSLLQQAHAGLAHGNRNFAYEYTLDTTQRFLDFAPEQQAFIVENYYAMKRDRTLLGMEPGQVPAGDSAHYESVHFGRDGFKRTITAAERRSEIIQEWDNHVRVIGQLQQMQPLSVQQLVLRRQELLIIRPPYTDLAMPPLSSGRDFLQVPSFLTVRFPGL